MWQKDKKRDIFKTKKKKKNSIHIRYGFHGYSIEFTLVPKLR